mmetsp:Transcript_10772/g.12334  ORF Transcript_10772/g.12334 Transcript_10772/m.12334 type:complete len:84 (+) Transcript_10772:360-611(+)
MTATVLGVMHDASSSSSSWVGASILVTQYSSRPSTHSISCCSIIYNGTTVHPTLTIENLGIYTNVSGCCSSFSTSGRGVYHFQ